MSARDGTTTADGARSGLPVEAVRRALNILLCFGPGRTEIGVTDVARELGMHKSTVHRLLGTLQSEGFVHQDDNGRYTLTWKVLQLSAAVAAHHGIHDAMLRALEPLTAETGETSHVGVLSDDMVLYVEKVESSHQLRMPSAVGRHVPLHSVALGKVLGAGLDTQTVLRILHRAPLERFTDNTLTEPEDILRALERVREDGYALDDEEIEEGLVCVAAPVRDASGATCAAISIAGPATRVRARLTENIAAVKQACADLSRMLGPDVQELRELSPSGGRRRAG